MISPRSYLFVPADSEKKVTKSVQCQSDAIIFDLEDSVLEDRKPVARDLIADFLKSYLPDKREMKIFVRINALDSGHTKSDLASVIAGKPDGIILPKSDSVQDVEKLANLLDEYENKAGINQGSIKILPIVTETPQALFNLGSYAPKNTGRLLGLCWGSEDLSAAIGAFTNKNEDGSLSFTYSLARSLCLLSAKAARVMAVDQVFTNFKNLQGLEKECEAAFNEGFDGKLAIHPDQIEVINRCFSPHQEQIEKAQRIVQAFEASPNDNVTSLDGIMLDKPHLSQALRILAKASLNRS